MISNCIRDLAFQLVQSTKTSAEADVYCFIYQTGEEIELQAGEVSIPAKLSDDCVLPRSIKEGSFVRVVALPIKRISKRIKRTRFFEEEFFFEVKEIEILSFQKFLQENIRIPHTMAVAEYFDLNPDSEFMYMLDDYLGGVLYGLKLKAFRSALLGAPFVNLFEEKKSGGISTTFIPDLDTRVKNGDLFLKKLSMCFPDDLRFGINLKIPSKRKFDLLDQRDVILKKTRKKTRVQQRYLSFLDQWRPLKTYYKESSISGLHMDFELSRLNTEDRKHDSDELVSTTASTLKVELPVMIGKDDVASLEASDSKKLWDISEDISNEVLYRRIMFQPSFDTSVIPRIIKEIFRSIEGIMNTDPYLSKAIGSKGAFNIPQWVNSVIQIARSEARLERKEEVSENLLENALNATIASRLLILEAYTGSGSALGEGLGAITLRVLNYLRREEEVTYEDLYGDFPNLMRQNVHDALKDLLEAGKIYEPRRGTFKPVPI